MKVSPRQVLTDAGWDHDSINAFCAWHEKHDDVWPEFCRFTIEAIRAGRKCGAKLIMERVRWESKIKSGRDFKANNNFTSAYGRIFEAAFPQHRGFFEKRKLKGLGGPKVPGRNLGEHWACR